MKLSMKLAAGFGLILFFLAVISGISIMQMSSLGNDVGTINQRTEQIENIYEMTKGFDEIARNVRTICLTSDSETNKRLENQYKAGKEKLNTALDRMDKITFTAKGRELAGKLRETVPSMLVLNDKVVDLGKVNKKRRGGPGHYG